MCPWGYEVRPADDRCGFYRKVSASDESNEGHYPPFMGDYCDTTNTEFHVRAILPTDNR